MYCEIRHQITDELLYKVYPDYTYDVIGTGSKESTLNDVIDDAKNIDGVGPGTPNYDNNNLINNSKKPVETDKEKMVVFKRAITDGEYLMMYSVLIE